MIAEDSVRFAHSGPSHNLLRPAIAELVSCGPLPLPVSGGGHASAISPTLPTGEHRPRFSCKSVAGSTFEEGICHVLIVKVWMVSA